MVCRKTKEPTHREIRQTVEAEDNCKERCGRTGTRRNTTETCLHRRGSNPTLSKTKDESSQSTLAHMFWHIITGYRSAQAVREGLPCHPSAPAVASRLYERVEIRGPNECCCGQNWHIRTVMEK